MTNNPHENPDDASNAPIHQKRSGFTLIDLVIVACIMLLLIALLLPAVSRSRNAARRPQCRNNLKGIGLAFHNYHDTYGAFPPAHTVNAEGKPLHGWRTSILPFLDGKPLYDKIDLSKPWDDPVNSAAYNTELAIFRCPSAILPPTHTVYLAVVTQNSAIRPTEPRPLSEITDGPSQTLMLIEVAAEHAVHWMAPQDADEAIILSFGPDTKLPHTGGVHAQFADGSVNFLPSDTKAAERRAMISATGNDNKVLETAPTN